MEPPNCPSRSYFHHLVLRGSSDRCPGPSGSALSLLVWPMAHGLLRQACRYPRDRVIRSDCGRQRQKCREAASAELSCSSSVPRRPPARLGRGTVPNLHTVGHRPRPGALADRTVVTPAALSTLASSAASAARRWRPRAMAAHTTAGAVASPSTTATTRRATDRPFSPRSNPPSAPLPPR